MGPLSLLGAEIQNLLGRPQSPNSYLVAGSSPVRMSQTERRL